ncbi:ketopantoate reductase family protein [Thermaerobacter subterraneus]|uniref:Ketopantoate reductase n=1 Tax=Thermaerobacter subterraneus DSM 13965 TaxID=867903 RepID=K6PLZ8_9FIRM|nr:2-dehydropantoate 2-reductase N-terminal domain-containing protein [Thermaerobacter subterraneus]EKP93897.1 ketopantoate reductase [Thermaerobacter subterraneus DSM 13965]
MRVVVAGAGAIGCLLGGLLAAGGHEVILVGRPDRLEAVARHGLVLDPLPGSPGNPPGPGAGAGRDGPGMAGVAPGAGPWPVAVVPSVWEAARGPAPDAVLVTVKMPALPQVLAQVAAAWPPAASSRPPRVVTFQNGIGAEEQAARLLGAGRVIAGTVTLSAALEGHRVHIYNARRGGIGLAPVPAPAARRPAGPAAGGPDREAILACRALAARWQATLPVPVITARDAATLKWSKLLLNLVGNAVGALLQWDVDRVFRHPLAAAVEVRSLREAVAVARRAAPRLVDLPGYPVRSFARCVQWLPPPLFRTVVGPRAAGGRGGKLPSVALDVAAGRHPTEIQALHGAVARTAASWGGEAPLCAALARLVDRAAADPAERARFRDRPDQLLAALRQEGAWPA